MHLRVIEHKVGTEVRRNPPPVNHQTERNIIMSATLYERLDGVERITILAILYSLKGDVVHV